MSTKTTIIISVAAFALFVFLIVVLPLLLGVRPAPSKPAAEEKPAEVIPDQGVFRSDDGGRTWQAKFRTKDEVTTIAAFKVNWLIADPLDAARLYLATDGNGLWVSTNRGEHWEPVVDQAGILEPEANVLALAVNPANTQAWYAAVFQKNRGRVLRTFDGGKTWREIYFTPLERFGVFDLHYDPASGILTIVTGQGGVLESEDKGDTWRVVRWFADGLVRLMVSPVNPGVRFVTTPGGSIFRTENRGETWVDATPALREFSGSTQNQRWLMDRRGVIYLGSNRGLLASYDSAATFEAPPLIIPPEALPVLAIAVDFQDSSRLIVAAGNQLYHSSDRGETWAILPSPTATKRISNLLIDREKPKTIYAVVQP